MDRRTLILGALTGIAALGVGSIFLRTRNDEAGQSGETFEIMMSEEEWRAQLSENQYLVLREEKTERPYSSPLLKEKRIGNYHCAACDLPLYASDTKFDSRTGWPSFYQAINDAVGTKPDNSLFATRTEVHCRRCGGHQGHIFNDGPAPTGKRHCINGIAMTFHPAGAPVDPA